MSTQVLSNLDFGSLAKILNLPIATANGQPVVYEQLLSAIEGLAWKDNVKVRAQVNITLSAPGTPIDGQAMSVGDTFLAANQTAGAENGKYVWNGAAVAATRAPDMNLSTEFTNAIIVVDAGTDAGKAYRCTNVNPVVGTDTIAFAGFGTGAGAASETSAGIAEIATQAETDAGTDDLRFITPLKLATSVYAIKRFAASFGDGVANSFTINHNFSSKDVLVQVYNNATGDQVALDIQRTNTNSLTLAVASGIVPTTNQYRCVVTR